MRTTRRTATAAIGVVVVAALGLAGCATEPEPTSAVSGELIEINVLDVLQSQKVQIASDEGFFEKHGLKVNVEQLATGTEIIAAVQGGSAEIGYADVYAGLNAINNGFDIQFVASNNGHSNSTPYLVKSDSDLDDVSDLEGKNLGLGGVPQFTVAANAFLESQDADPSKVTFVITKQTNALPEALENGSVDAIQATWPQAYSNAGQEGGFDFRVLGEPSNENYLEPTATSAGFWSTSSWAEANPETAQKFADALREFNAWWLDLDVDKLTELNKTYYEIDLVAIANGDEEALERLTKNDNLITGPIDIDATNEWIETGITYAPELIPSGVDFESHIFASAK